MSKKYGISNNFNTCTLCARLFYLIFVNPFKYYNPFKVLDIPTKGNEPHRHSQGHVDTNKCDVDPKLSQSYSPRIFSSCFN